MARRPNQPPRADDDGGPLPPWLQRLTESYSKVRLPRGVVGKTGHVMLMLIALWLVIAWRLPGTVQGDLAHIVVGIVATAAVIWWVRSSQDFAERNPAQAILEGAEFIEYRKFEVQMKGGPIPHAETVLIPNPDKPQTPLISANDPDDDNG